MEKKNEEVCRAGTSEKVHDGADGFLEATALWKRFLVDFALSETQVLILYVFTESKCDIYFYVLFGEYGNDTFSLSHGNIISCDTVKMSFVCARSLLTISDLIYIKVNHF